jgi:hypothetical protein
MPRAIQEAYLKMTKHSYGIQKQFSHCKFTPERITLDFLSSTTVGVLPSAHPEEIRVSLRSLPTSPRTKPWTDARISWGHWPLHNMSITPNIIMICIDIQGEEHHCQEEHHQTDALIGRLYIDAWYATKLGVIGLGFVHVWRRERVLWSPDFVRMPSAMPERDF